MRIFTFDPTPSTRFRVLVNGFADGAAFPSLDEAIDSIPDTGVERSSFEIYDALERAYVWTRQRRNSGWPAPFSIRRNGRPNGQSFASLDEAKQAISGRASRVRPDVKPEVAPEISWEVFEAATRVFAPPPHARAKAM